MTTYYDGSLGRTIIKDPDAVLDYTFSWKDWLSGIGDQIVTHVITAAPGITVDSEIPSTKKVVVWLSGGTVGTTYSVACKVTTVGGRTDERTIYVKVEER